MNTPAELTVVLPLFPRHPGLRRALASLRAQTRRPDFVLLLDDGTNPDAGSLGRELPGLAVETVQAGTSNVAEAVNRAAELLRQSEFVAILTSGGAYLPPRLERCLAAMRDPARFRAPGIIVTAIEPVDGQGTRFAPDDPRRAQLERLWAPGRAGLSIPEWLGSADFVLGATNIFARRAYLAANPLPTDTQTFAYHAAVQAGVQGMLGVIDEPLLELVWSGREKEPSALGLAGILRAQLAMLATLRDKLATSPETRRSLATFHRAAWNNLSGLREDLFLQAALQLTSLAAPAETAKAIERVTSASNLPETPPFLRELRESGTPTDPAAYAAALAKTRAELAALRDEHARVGRVAAAAQSSGWVRLGAWLGERSARRIMEMEAEEKESLQPPDGEVEGRGENNPDQIGNKQPSGNAADGTERAAGQHDGGTEKNDLEKRETGVVQSEENRRP